MDNPLALEFVKYTLTHNPGASDFATIYDAMTRMACTRSFRNLSYRELAQIGISFSLLSTNELEYLITEAQKALSLDNAARL